MVNVFMHAIVPVPYIPSTKINGNFIQMYVAMTYTLLPD